jgi:transposase InsO family protein
MELRDAMQRIAVEWPSYGRPRITAELRRRGWRVNPKRVYRLMREDNLLCVRRRKFVVTTDSNHTRKVYPNLARNMILTATDQLWVADITYIRLRDEFVFLQHHATISMSRKGNPYDKDYASHCTSWVLCAMTWFTRRRWDSFTPCAFRGGLSPGCSNRQSFLSL